jgi:hypothetical protein
MPERRQYIPGKSPEDKIQRRREITIPSEGKGPGWLVAFIFLIIGFVVGVAAEHYVKILDKILSG